MKKLFTYLFFASFGAFAQTSRILSPVLESYIQEGLKQNLALKQERLEILKSDENITQAKAN